MKGNLNLIIRRVAVSVQKYHTSSIFLTKQRGSINMPRNPEYLQNIQICRKKKIMKSAQYHNSNMISLHILGSGACGTPSCLFVSTEGVNFMFNCGEGTQRLANEHRFKLTKLGHVFVTEAKWKNLGGIPGLILTIQDHGVPRLGLHGPQGTYDLLKAVQKFVSLTTMEIVDESANNTQSHETNIMTVTYVPISRESEEPEECISELVDETEYYRYDNSNGKRVGSDVKTKAKLRKVETKLQRITDVMCYICTTHPKAGALSLEKCLEFGVKPGPDLGLLKSGQDIELDDGRIVRSKDVCEPDKPGLIFMVVDCPTEEYFDSFLNNSEFAKYYYKTTKEEETLLCCIVHFTPDALIKSPRYQEWINKFPTTTDHIILNDGNRCMGSESVHKSQNQLHLLHPEIFPYLKDNTFGELEEFHDPRLHRAKTKQSLSLRPPKKFPDSSGICLEPKKYTDEMFDIDGFPEALEELRRNIDTETKLLPDRSDYPRIVMLGTGSSIPNKVRNTSAILIRTDESHSVLLDCGEGTFGQIVRFFGVEYKNILSTIKAIYVSHLHADHHLGLISLLNERSKLTKDPVYLLAPEQIEAWLQFYHNRFEQISDLYTLVANQILSIKNRTICPSLLKEMKTALNLWDVSTTYVKHCWFAFGVSLTLPDGKKIVYSGDTMPCDSLVELGKDCDLLIHEATMEDDLLDEAKLKSHSTTSQAIHSGQLMNAKFVLLTHFSQRYSKLPQIPEGKNVGIAYDYMDIKFSHITLLPLLYPCLKLMYNQYHVAMEGRAIKRSAKALKAGIKRSV